VKGCQLVKSKKLWHRHFEVSYLLQLWCRLVCGMVLAGRGLSFGIVGYKYVFANG